MCHAVSVIDQSLAHANARVCKTRQLDWSGLWFLDSSTTNAEKKTDRGRITSVGQPSSTRRRSPACRIVCARIDRDAMAKIDSSARYMRSP
jgi:hypothetical protein